MVQVDTVVHHLIRFVANFQFFVETFVLTFARGLALRKVSRSALTFTLGMNPESVGAVVSQC